MKKFFLAIALVAMSVPAFAQAELPEKGDLSTELQFNPFSNNFSTFRLDEIRLRYFMTDNDALRFGIGFGVQNDKDEPSPKADVANWTKYSMGNFNVNLGYERHIVKKGRIDLYVGGDIFYQADFASSKAYNEVKNVTGTDAAGNPTYTITSSETSYSNVALDAAGTAIGRAANTFGVKVVTGIDFYVYKGLYLGAELGLRFAAKTQPGWTSKTTVTNVAPVETDPADKVTGMSFNTACAPALRIGWTF